jgi:hypothetical protein
VIAEETGYEITVRKLTLSSHISGYYKKTPFERTYTFQTRTSPPTLTVTMPTNVKCLFSIRKKNWFDRFSEAIGLAGTISTGDPAFDQLFFIDTADRESVEAVLADGQLIEYIIHLFDNDAKQVCFDRRGVSVVFKLAPKEIPTLRTFFYGLKMAYKIEVLQGRAPIRRQSMRLDGVTFRHRLGVVMAVLIAVGGGLTLAGVEMYPPLFPSLGTVTETVLPYLIALFIFFNLINWLMVRTSTDRHVTLVVFFLVSIPAFFLLTVGPVYFSNGYLDDSPVVEKNAKVLKTFTKGRGGRKVSFLVDGRTSADLDRGRSRCEAGDPVRMTIRAGRFDIPWVANWEILPKEQPTSEK